MKPLLGWTVEGHVWTLHIAYQNPDDKAVVSVLSVDNRNRKAEIADCFEYQVRVRSFSFAPNLY